MDQKPLEQVVTSDLIVGWEWEDAARPSAHAKKSPPPSANSLPAPVRTYGESERYPLRRLLGQGGMGEVQLCKDLTIGRDVAMKRMLPVHAADANARARFIREAQIQGQLEHPAIVPVYDLAADADGGVFFTMKRLRGRSLADILEGLASGRPEDRDAFPLHRLLQTFSSICLAVEFAHSRGVLHRDLKPANIMLGDFGEVYVLDWGLAKIQADPSEPGVSDHASQEGLPTAEIGAALGPEAEDKTLSFAMAGEGGGGVVHSAEAVKTARGQVVGTVKTFTTVLMKTHTAHGNVVKVATGTRG